MTRKTEGVKKSISVRFDEDLYDRILKAAEERTVSANLLVNKACEYYLERLLPVDQIVWTKDDPRPPVYRFNSSEEEV